jgi:hypothetical protein
MAHDLGERPLAILAADLVQVGGPGRGRLDLAGDVEDGFIIES